MIKAIPVTRLEQLNDEIHQIYLDSFPVDERREWTNIQKLIAQPNFTFNQLFDGKNYIGFISLWNLANFTFIEHLAIHESCQGKGIGSHVIRQVIAERSTKIILEVDEPHTAISKKRISFYERLGFSICDCLYYQPPYSANKNEVKMLLMSYPDKINPMEFQEVKTQIHREVYGKV